MKTVKLPIANIALTTVGEGHGSISSTLYEDWLRGEAGEEDRLKAVVDAVESLILGHAAAGVDVTAPAYLEGLETALQAIVNHME